MPPTWAAASTTASGPLDGHRVEQVELLVALAHQILIAARFQVVPNGAAYQSVMTCNEYF